MTSTPRSASCCAASPTGPPCGPATCWRATFTGGGGYGDPLEREPERVAHDVAHEYVSREAAASLYGVAITDDGTVDLPETERLRAQERDRRSHWDRADALVGAAARERLSPATGEPERRVHEYLVACDHEGSRVLRCSHCQEVISDYRGNYKLGLLADVQPVTVIPHVIDPSYFLDDAMTLRYYCCPGCQVLMSVELVRGGEAPLAEFRLK